MRGEAGTGADAEEKCTSPRAGITTRDPSAGRGSQDGSRRRFLDLGGEPGKNLRLVGKIEQAHPDCMVSAILDAQG
jgi:hypothetical protein